MTTRRGKDKNEDTLTEQYDLDHYYDKISHFNISERLKSSLLLKESTWNMEKNIPRLHPDSQDEYLDELTLFVLPIWRHKIGSILN